MKKLVFGAFLFGLLAVAGLAIAADAVPDLKGTWEPQMDMVAHHGAETKHKTTYQKVLVVIDSQQGRSFGGAKMLIKKGKTKKENLSGVVYWDNKTVYIADHDKGIFQGSIEAPTEIRGVYLEEGKHAKAVLTVWKRVK